MSENGTKPALLLVSGGSLVAQNVVQALGSRRGRLRLLATNSRSDEPSLQDFDEVRLVPPTAENGQGELGHRLVEWIESARPALVIPCRDDDVVFLAMLARHQPELAQRLLCGAVEPAAAMLDKWRSFELSRGHGLPFAASVLVSDELEVERFVQEHGFPLIVKPRKGFASRGVTLVFKRAQLDGLIGNTDMLLQEYLGGYCDVSDFMLSVDRVGLPLFHSFEATKLSIQASIAPDGSTMGLFATLHRMRQGVSVAVEPDESDDALLLGSKCAEVFSMLGWRGPLNIQCQRRPNGELAIYEFNGRFTGATAARAMLGFDEVATLLRLFARVELPRLRAASASIVIRQPASRTTLEQLRSSLERDGLWRNERSP